MRDAGGDGDGGSGREEKEKSAFRAQVVRSTAVRLSELAELEKSRGSAGEEPQSSGSSKAERPA